MGQDGGRWPPFARNPATWTGTLIFDDIMTKATMVAVTASQALLVGAIRLPVTRCTIAVLLAEYRLSP